MCMAAKSSLQLKFLSKASILTFWSFLGIMSMPPTQNAQCNKSFPAFTASSICTSTISFMQTQYLTVIFPPILFFILYDSPTCEILSILIPQYFQLSYLHFTCYFPSPATSHLSPKSYFLYLPPLSS